MIAPGLFFVVLGVLCVLLSRAAGRSSALIRDAMAGRAVYVEGGRVAVLGTIESEMAPMLSPARNEPCLLYAYSVEDENGKARFHGCGAVPCFVASEGRTVRLLEFPLLGHFDPSEPEDHEKASQNIGARVASAVQSLTPPLIEPGRESLSAGRPWTFDARTGSFAFDAASMTISEQIVPPHHRVIALGTWSSAGLEKIQLLNDEREMAYERAGRQRKFWRNIGLIGILIGVAFFVAEMLT